MHLARQVSLRQHDSKGPIAFQITGPFQSGTRVSFSQGKGVHSTGLIREKIPALRYQGAEVGGGVPRAVNDVLQLLSCMIASRRRTASLATRAAAGPRAAPRCPLGA